MTIPDAVPTLLWLASPCRCPALVSGERPGEGELPFGSEGDPPTVCPSDIATECPLGAAASSEP